MDYDKDRVDELTLALLYLVMSKTPTGGRAAKGHDLATLLRLQKKGWVAPIRMKDLALEITPEGVKKAEELFRKYIQSP